MTSNNTFSGDWEWNDILDCYETAFTAVRFGPPLSMGVTPVVSPRVMDVLVARFAFLRARDGVGDFWSWDGNGVRVQHGEANPMSDDDTEWLLPDADGNFDLGVLGYTFGYVGEDANVMHTVGDEVPVA